MTATTAKPGEKFRHVRLELAREQGHPLGDRAYGYDLVIPLDAEGNLDARECARHREHCRVRRFRPGEEDMVGALRRRPGGQWFFDYGEGEEDDELGFRFSDERFVPGEYVSILSDGVMHTYQVKRVEKI